MRNMLDVSPVPIDSSKEIRDVENLLKSFNVSKKLRGQDILSIMLL
jgi:hypothetical protein